MLAETQPSEYQPYFVPLVWALNVVSQARKEGHIRFDRAVEILTDEITAFRGRLGAIFAFDWINPPLVYTQVRLKNQFVIQMFVCWMQKHCYRSGVRLQPAVHNQRFVIRCRLVER